MMYVMKLDKLTIFIKEADATEIESVKDELNKLDYDI